MQNESLDMLIRECYEELEPNKLPLRMIDEYFKELIHGAPVLIGEPIKKEGKSLQLAFNAWGLLKSPQRIEQYVQWAINKMGEHLNSEYSVVCACSATALPIAALIAVKLGKKSLLTLDNLTYHFSPDPPKADDMILLVDTIIQTGYHISLATDKIDKLKAHVSAVLCIGINDSAAIRYSISQHHLFFLTRLSDYYENWKMA